MSKNTTKDTIIRRKSTNSDRKKVSKIIKFIQSEIEKNTQVSVKLIEYKENLYKENFSSLSIKSTDIYEESLLTEDKLDKKKIKYFNEIDKELDVYLIYRNFLLLLDFMNTFNNRRDEMRPFIAKDDSFFTTVVTDEDKEKNKDEKKTKIVPLRLSTLFRNLFIFEKIRKNDEQYNTYSIQQTFNKFIDIKLKGKNSFTSEFPIDISFSNMLVDSEEYEVKINEKDTTVKIKVGERSLKKVVHIEENTAKKEMTAKNISIFYSSFKSLSQLGYESSIRLFWEVLEGKHNNHNIPQSLNSFLRYYVLNDKYQVRSEVKNVSISGVGYDSLVSRFILDGKNVKKKGYEFAKKLNLYVNDKNILVQQCRYIQFKIIDQTLSSERINQLDFLNSENNKVDVSISIPPIELPTYLSEEFLNTNTKTDKFHDRFTKYLPLPSKNLSALVHYYDTVELMKSKSFIVVPLSFISVIDSNNSEKDKSIHIDIKKHFERKKVHETILYNQRIKEIIDERQIKKIMLLSKGMMTHTHEQCVLLELSKDKVDGIHIIDSVSKFSKILNNQSVLENNNYIKKVFDYDGVDDVYVDKNSKIVDSEYSQDKYLVSRYVSYKEIQGVYNYNLLPSYHLTDTQWSTQFTKVVDDFEIIKSQRKTYKSGHTNLYELGQTSFSRYGISNVSGIKKKIQVEIKKDNSYFLKDGDILIYETYKNREHMTYFEMSRNHYVLGTHNLFIIRTKNIELSKELFMYLYSDEGQKKLLSLVKSNGTKEVLTVESLNQLSWARTDKSFDLYEKEVKKLEKKEKYLLKLLK